MAEETSRHVGYTLAEAYNLQKKKEFFKKNPRRSREIDVNVTSAHELNQLVIAVIGMLKEPGRKNESAIFKILSHLPQAYKSMICECVDEDSLTMLHHCIINDHPEVIDFILREANLFPSEHQPIITPYAHLAASLGHAECLKTLLAHRPDDFFTTSEPQHVIALPNELMKKFNLHKAARSGMSKNMDKLLDRINATATEAERALQQGKHTPDIVQEIEGELGQLEVKMKQQKVRVTKSKSFASASSIVSKKRAPTKGGENDLEDEEKMTLVRPKKGKHHLTFHTEVIENSAASILRGAGENVKIQRRDSSALPPIDLSVPDVRKMIPRSVHSQTTRSRGHVTSSERSLRSTSQRFLDAPRPASQVSLTNSTSSKAAVDSINMNIAAKTRHSYKDIRRTDSKSAGKHKIEMGVRVIKKYKEFKLKMDSRPVHAPDESSKFMNKTPLTMAAERGYFECVQTLLERVVLKKNPMIPTQEPLTLATKARSPEAIVFILEKRISKVDYQSSVLLAIREMYPDCLAALLSTKNKDREHLFDGTNLYHVLYTQSLVADYRYEMLPEMTRVLIDCKEDVNALNVPRTFPLYTLINCAFNIHIGKQIFFFVESLEILLKARANPHFDEIGKHRLALSQPMRKEVSFGRNPYSSAMHCLMESAHESLKYFENSYWSRLFIRKIAITIERYDQTRRRILNDVLFQYMAVVCRLGMDRAIVKCLLRYGANPDFKLDGKYAIIVYFEHLLPYLVKFEVVNSYDRYKAEVNCLMLLCDFMSYKSIREAILMFMNELFATTPVQALPVCRYFCWCMNNRLRHPNRLTRLAAYKIWTHIGRNVKRARQLPLPLNVLNLILP